jgi:hypothetical protein
MGKGGLIWFIYTHLVLEVLNPCKVLGVAEREGFEPSVPFRVHMISNHAH